MREATAMPKRLVFKDLYYIKVVKMLVLVLKYKDKLSALYAAQIDL